MSLPGVFLRLAGTAAALSSYALILPLGPPAAQAQASRIPVIDTIEGFNTANRMGRIASAKVRVIDQSQRPIERALVTFQLPENGVFLGGSRKADIETNDSGEAQTPGICPTGLGDFPISATATVGDQQALATIPQRNENPQFGKVIISPIEGNKAINVLKQGKATEPVVQIIDENHMPVACALVTFSLPKAGPSGVFGNGQLTLASRTNAEGKATGTGLRPNAQSGKVIITVTASVPPLTGAINITQTNAGSGHARLVVVLLAVAGAGGGAAVALARGHGSSSSSPASSTPTSTVITIGPGPGSFGTPPVH